MSEQAAALRTDADRAAEALEAAAVRLTELAGEAAPTRPPPAERTTSGRSTRSSGTTRRRAKSSTTAKAEDEAMLRATKLAVSGMDRKAIAVRLRKELGVSDAAPILDRVMGPAQRSNPAS